MLVLSFEFPGFRAGHARASIRSTALSICISFSRFASSSAFNSATYSVSLFMIAAVT